MLNKKVNETHDNSETDILQNFWKQAFENVFQTVVQARFRSSWTITLCGMEIHFDWVDLDLRQKWVMVFEWQSTNELYKMLQ